MISPKLQISVVQIILLFFILPFLRNPTTLTMARSVETLMEWILLKYEIPQLQSATGQQGSLQFDVCVCPTSSGNPSSSPQCRCEKTVVEGKPLHKAHFPSSCLTQPEATNKKCSVVRLRLTNPALGTFIYIRTRLGNLALTQPEFQQLSAGNGQMKSIARLSTGEGNKFISLAYSIQIPLSDSSFPSPPSLTVNSMKPAPAGVQLISKNHLKKGAEKRMKSTSVEKSGKHADQQKTVTFPSTIIHTTSSQQSSSSTSAVVAPPATALLCQLIPQMGLDANQIRQFLMHDAEQQRVHPLQFDVERFKRAVIRIHNRYRQMHAVDDLAHDGGCESSAKSWADSVARHAACLSHEPQQRYGESLFFYSTLLPLLSDPETLAEATVRTFYVEGRDYRRSAGRWDAVRHGHFTQMLWRQTQRIGVGVSIQQQPTGAGQCTPQGRHGQQAWLFYVVLRYEPPGNIRRWGEDSFELNVPGAERTSDGLDCLIVE